MPDRATFLVLFFLGTTALKLLLQPSYRSTDFEVHRNWLAITYSLPIHKWYFNNTSEWTLDYPPFFAYFQWVLAQTGAALNWDPEMLRISAAPYASDPTVLFQRLSVAVTDVLLLVGILVWVQTIPAATGSPSRIGTLAMMTLASAGLLMVDHMHFQYNGMLLGILFLSMAALRKGWILAGAALFASLLMFKHLFLSLAPVYFVYLLSSYCYTHPPPPGKEIKSRFRPVPFLLLASTVLAVFAAALGPLLFAHSSTPSLQLHQLGRRLFPFGRGIVHAYWAPNMWALYCLEDLGLAALSRRLHLPFLDRSRPSSAPTWTSGLVQVIEPEVLPPVSPLLAAVLTILSMVPALVLVWKRPTPRNFLLGLFQTGLSAFMLGYHVHEKAVLVPVMVGALLACSYNRSSYGRLFFWLSTIGYASLLPLFPPLSPDSLTAFLLIHLHALGSWFGLGKEGLLGGEGGGEGAFSLLESLYLAGLECMLWTVAVIHPLFAQDRFPFGACLVSSVYCSTGMVGVWAESYRLLWQEHQEGGDEGGEEGGKGRVGRAESTSGRRGGRRRKEE
jgi:alpha-1,3-glucosyltransferase